MAKATKKKIEHEGGSDSALERLKLFSDAVMAIAMTLLVIEIRLPNEHHLTDARLLEILGSLWPRYLGFFVSFAVIAFLWIAHWRKYQMIERASSRLVWLNFLFLLAICCIPFTTAVLGEHGDLRVAVIVYAATMVFALLCSTTLTLYGYRAGLMKASVSADEVKKSIRNSLFTATVFAISIGIAFFDPQLAKYFWFVLLGSMVFSIRAPVR
ncbi:MAG: DUF1211 domain-containing protein [Xanthobacteraceae bacterium]|nr:DUF1211 domain-containing protein [Xanthobacteraceae bacterium]